MWRWGSLERPTCLPIERLNCTIELYYSVITSDRFWKIIVATCFYSRRLCGQFGQNTVSFKSCLLKSRVCFIFKAVRTRFDIIYRNLKNASSSRTQLVRTFVNVWHFSWNHFFMFAPVKPRFMFKKLRWYNVYKGNLNKWSAHMFYAL